MQVDIDQAKALSLGLSLSDVNATLTAAWAGDHVNDFIDRTRVKKVYVQGDAPYRARPEDLDPWRVRGTSGVMTPFSAFATTRWTYGPETLSRFNGPASYEIDGASADGVSSGTALDRMEAHAKALPPGTDHAWSGLSYQERLSSGQTTKLYAISIRSRASTGTGDDGTVVSTSSSAEVGLSACEIDLFGRLRALSAEALETYLSTAETARATRISLIAETASAWLTLASDRSKLALARNTAESAQRTMALTQRRQAAGVASLVDVRSAETTCQQARADAATLVATIAQDRNALELLVGSPVDDARLPDGLPDAGTHWLADVPAGVSSEVLLQRPDVLAAEHTLKAANADIGAARAQFFPTLSLTAAGGVASTALSSLFTGGATVWSLAPSLGLPIFDGGANRANLDYSKAQKQGDIASYEATVQTAFEEVANALATRGTVQERLDALTALVAAAAESYRLAEARYSRGADTFLNALDARRTLYTAQSSLVSTQIDELTSRVSLYRYLGGGLAGTADAVASR